jgi:hypothetical protein
MRTAALLVFLAAVGCDPSPVPPQVPPQAAPPTVTLPPAAPAPTAAPDEAPPVVVNLDSAEAFEILAVLETIGHAPVLVDAAALATLRCATVSVKTGDRVPVAVAAEKIAAALRALHYRVEHAAGQWVVSADPASAPAACAPRAPPPAAVAEGPEVAKEVAQSIRRVSATEYVLTRHGLEVLLEHSQELFQHARLVPEQAGGKVVGIRIFGVREDDTLGHLGLLNGDRVERLAGQPVNDPQKALEAYVKVTKSNRVVLELVRQGKPLKIVYRVE